MIIEQAVPEPEPSRSSPAARLGRLQLAAIGAVVVLAAGIGLVLGLTILSGRGQSALGTSASYVPADAVVYMEARLDLPAGQRESLLAILERFPGVNADEVLGAAMADTLDEALASMRVPATYSTDIAPWFDGRVALSLLDYPLNMDPMSPQLPTMAFLVGVRDSAAAGSLADTLRSEMEAVGATFTSSDHGGTAVWTLDVATTQQMLPGAGFAYALTDDQLLLANGRETVERLLDVRGGAGDSLEERAELRDLAGHLPAEWAGIMTADIGAMLESTRAQLEATSPELADALEAYLQDVPTFVATTVGFEDDAVRFDAVTGLPGGDLAPSNGQRALAGSVPSDAIFFSDGGNVGPGLVHAITGIRTTIAAVPGAESGTAQLEQVEAALGANLEEFVSWIGSGAMAAGWDGEQAWFGLVLEAADADAAAQRLGQLRALVELAALDPSTEVHVSTETVEGVEVTSISVATPAMTAGPPISELVVQYALDGDTAVIGLGDRFVGRALGIAPGGSLAESDRFQGAIERFGGDDNAGALFLDLVALREAVEGAVPQESLSGYDSEVRPNLLPLDYLAGVNRVEGDALVSRYGLVFTP
jgi:hypothetical protein